MNLVPFVMGVTGFTVLDGQPVVDSLFLSMEMYFLNYSDSPPNILIEIAETALPYTGITFTEKKWYRHWDPAG